MNEPSLGKPNIFEATAKNIARTVGNPFVKRKRELLTVESLYDVKRKENWYM